MYNLTENDRISCMNIVKDILKLKNDYECEQYVNKVVKTIYAIGGDYSEKTIRYVTKALFNKM